MSYHATRSALGATSTADQVSELQRQVNRFLPTGPLPVTGVLDSATNDAAAQLVIQAYLLFYTQDPTNAAKKSLYVEASTNLATGATAAPWLADHVVEATDAIRQLGNAQGKGGPGVSTLAIAAAAAAGLFLLTRSHR